MRLEKKDTMGLDSPFKNDGFEERKIRLEESVGSRGNFVYTLFPRK